MSKSKVLRRLPLHHAYNVRDLGGFPIQDTGVTAWNRCYRSDHLHALDDHDWMVLKEAQIALILDLRSLDEQKSAAYECNPYGIHCMSLPFMKEELPVAKDFNEEAREHFLKSMTLDYVKMLQEAAVAMRIACEEIAQTLQNGKAVLFHCTAGKDRTGILACVLLDLCGVEKSDIIADYQVSATFNENGVNRMLPKEMMAISSVQALLKSEPIMLEPLLDFLHNKGTQQYLLDIGVRSAVIETIKEQLIVSL